MYDPSSTHLTPLSRLAREVPNRAGGCGINHATVWRWGLRGLRGHRLRTQLVGGIRMSCGLWLNEFFTALTHEADGQSVPQCQTSRQRQEAIEQAERDLERTGL
jgi:hypothetical protein